MGPLLSSITLSYPYVPNYWLEITYISHVEPTTTGNISVFGDTDRYLGQTFAQNQLQDKRLVTAHVPLKCLPIFSGKQT